jgi:hypothetical protein
VLTADRSPPFYPAVWESQRLSRSLDVDPDALKPGVEVGSLYAEPVGHRPDVPACLAEQSAEIRLFKFATQLRKFASLEDVVGEESIGSPSAVLSLAE